MQIGMMAGFCKDPLKLDNLMNEGIAFAIDYFKDRIPDCPVGQRLAMIGRRKPVYDSIGKVMRRLDRIMKVLEAMRHIVVKVH